MTAILWKWKALNPSALLNFKRSTSTKVNGRIMSEMAAESNNGAMAPFTKATGAKTWPTATGD